MWNRNTLVICYGTHIINNLLRSVSFFQLKQKLIREMSLDVQLRSETSPVELLVFKKAGLRKQNSTMRI